MNLAENGFVVPEVATRERMSDADVGNIVSAVGNLESKALLLTLLANSPGTIFTDDQMAQSMARIQDIRTGDESGSGWVPEPSSLENYCSDSFSAIGLVARGIREGDNTYGYYATYKGQHDGVALAGHLLDYSAKRDKALRVLLSETSSHSKIEIVLSDGQPIEFKSRAPINRLKIYRSLLGFEEAVRIKDIADDSGVDAAIVSKHCQDLKWYGIIEKDSVSKEGSRTDYSFKGIPEDMPMAPRYDALTKEILELFVSAPNENWTRSSIVEALIAQSPERQSQTALVDSVRKVLIHLRKHDAIETPNFTQGSGSKVTLNPQQRELLQELVTIVDNFQDGSSDFLQRGKQLAFKYLTTPALARDAMRRSGDASTLAQAIPTVDIHNAITSAMHEIANITAEQVREYLKNYYDYNLALPTIRTYLRNMRQSGEAASVGVVGGVMHWNVRDAS